MQWLEQCREWVRKYDPVRPEMLIGKLHHYGAFRRISEMLPSNAIVIYDTGGNAIMMGHCFQSKTGQRIFSSNGNSAMGTAMCAAIGAWFAEPDRPVICMIGDGGMQLNLQELQTIKHYGVKIKVIIENNFSLGNTRVYQIQNGKKALACGPDGYSCPDFTAIAQAYGLHGVTIDTWAQFDAAMKNIMESDEAVICDIQHPYFCDYQPRMSIWQGGIEEAFPPLPQHEFASIMIVSPVDGWQERRKQYKEISDGSSSNATSNKVLA